ncbi:MAG: LPXTG cell wall anchor domain-containing protein, partial [Actinomycetia bacterium]|nr:LPXTG cell wall anchor domain-containing protein [Actinomycetes bacterium]
SVTDLEDGAIPLSKLSVSGYDNIAWSVVNYPGGDGYVIRLTVKDSGGLDAPFKEIAVFVESANAKVTPLAPNDPRIKDLPTPPAGYKWGVDPWGHVVLYAPAAAPRGGLPKTSDAATVTIPLVLAFMLALALLALRKRTRLA